MPIHKRPRDHAEPPSATKSEDASDAGRNPMLQGLRKDVYDFIAMNPDCTRAAVSAGTGIRSSSATARIKELIDEGFVFEPGGRVANKSGVRSKCLRITSRQRGGKPLDKVRVKVTLTIDHNGNYHAYADVVGGKPLTSTALPIKHHEVTITAPHPDTYSRLSEQAGSGVVRINRLETQTHAADIIEGEIISPEDD